MQKVLLVVVVSAVAGCGVVAPFLGIPVADVFYRLDIEAEGGKKKEEK